MFTRVAKQRLTGVTSTQCPRGIAGTLGYSTQSIQDQLTDSFTSQTLTKPRYEAQEKWESRFQTSTDILQNELGLSEDQLEQFMEQTKADNHFNLNNEDFVTYGHSKRTKTAAVYHEIFPDVVQQEFTPNVNLIVKYSEQDDGVVHRGNILSVDQLDSQPEVEFTPLSEDDFYAMLLVSADPLARSFSNTHQLVWSVTNIKGNQINNGNTLVPYTPVSTQSGTGLHRFVFILSKQLNGEVTDVTVNPDEFDTTAFLQQNGMEPQGLAFFQTGDVDDIQQDSEFELVDGLASLDNEDIGLGLGRRKKQKFQSPKLTKRIRHAKRPSSKYMLDNE
eukprot:TRINITY_DN1962_c0_g1_i2.p1 TRINITY_DN1962_c0_g1~~TRINITY_DN1962_c0_g1_i2.p1  ORF type:complete len:333 (-),score=98.38 TRINITY_DN1962_c0_g1_i2:18-1016(-)